MRVPKLVVRYWMRPGTLEKALVPAGVSQSDLAVALGVAAAANQSLEDRPAVRSAEQGVQDLGVPAGTEAAAGRRKALRRSTGSGISCSMTRNGAMCEGVSCRRTSVRPCWSTGFGAWRA